MPITVAQIHGKDHLFFKENGGWSSPPLVLINHLASLDLCSQERHICLILLNHRYSLSMALMDLGELAQEFGKSIRQVQRWIKRLRERDLIKVTPRPGRPSIIDVSPLIISVKKLVGWQEEEQPAPVVETLVEVVAEPEPDLSLLPDEAPDELEEDYGMVGADLDWDTIKRKIKEQPGISRDAFRSWLADTEGLRWEDDLLVVGVKSTGQLMQMGRFIALANLLIQDEYENALGVCFEVKKKPKKLGTLAALAVAAVGVH